MNGKRIVVFGAGAIGSAIASGLRLRDHDVTIVDPWFLHVETIKRHGLRVTAAEQETVASVAALHIDELSLLAGSADIVVLAVKSYDTEWAVRLIVPYMSSDGFIVSAQNGLNEERIAAIIGGERTVGCVVAMGGMVEEPGHMVCTSSVSGSAFYVGELDRSVSRRVRELCAILEAVGPSAVSEDIWARLWSKLAVNCMSNAICGLTGMSAGEWRVHPLAQRIGIRIAAETVEVAQALGFTVAPLPGGLTPEIVIETARGHSSQGYAALERHAAERFSGTTTANPSLLQDVHKGRRTEVRYLNGAVVEKARSTGVDVPVNTAIAELISRIEIGELNSDSQNLQQLAEKIT